MGFQLYNRFHEYVSCMIRTKNTDRMEGWHNNAYLKKKTGNTCRKHYLIEFSKCLQKPRQKQSWEKSPKLEFDKPVNMCFVDMSKAFDRVRIKDVLEIMRSKGLNTRLNNVISDINIQCRTNITTKDKYKYRN